MDGITFIFILMTFAIAVVALVIAIINFEKINKLKRESRRLDSRTKGNIRY